mgnify:CR=1 FL=1
MLLEELRAGSALLDRASGVSSGRWRRGWGAESWTDSFQVLIVVARQRREETLRPLDQASGCCGRFACQRVPARKQLCPLVDLCVRLTSLQQ